MRAFFVVALAATLASAWLVNPDPRATCPSGHLKDNEHQWQYGPSSLSWANICPAYAACAGCGQSPLNIPAKTLDTDLVWGKGTIGVNYGPTDINFVRVDSLISMPVSGSAAGPGNQANTIFYQNASWTLKHIELKHPAEHSIDGKVYDFEMQLMHEWNGHWTGVAVLFMADECDNEHLESLWCFLPKQTCCMCGNGILEPHNPFNTEECDRGALNNNTDSACRPDCKKPVCGDRTIDAINGEFCDNGSLNGNGDGQCRTGAAAGAGVISNGRVLDADSDGLVDVGLYACHEAMCGDGVTDRTIGEECDHGAQIEQSQFNKASPSSSWCDAQCRYQCGNERIDTLFAAHPTHAIFKFRDTTWAQEGCDLGALNSAEPNALCRPHDFTIETGEAFAPVPSPTGYDVISGACMEPFCGDGVTDSGEECDGGLWNRASTEGGFVIENRCRPDCTFPRCGDGLVDTAFAARDFDTGLDLGLGAEQCDPGVNVADPLCNSTTCQFFCGDGIVDAGEECDSGINNSDEIPDRCRTDCRMPSCGDGVTDASLNEMCDDLTIVTYVNNGGTTVTETLAGSRRCWGNSQIDSDGMAIGVNDSCTFRCGNSDVDQGDVWAVQSATPPPVGDESCDNGRDFLTETLDDNSDENPNACRTDCTFYTCGDGVTDNLYTDAFPDHGGEQCDDGVFRDGNSAYNSDEPDSRCRPNCLFSCCGDNVVDPGAGEECDDGANNNQDNNAGCSSDCKLLCGDAVRGEGEDCDDGARNSDLLADRCRASTCMEHSCGDGITDSDEECDYRSPSVESVNCRADCTLPYCGDNVLDLELQEECDSGDSLSNTEVNGCSKICTFNSCSQSVPFGVDEVSSVDLRHFVPNRVTFGDSYVYEGSWTHPPCTENVEWIVNVEAQPIGVSQLARFADVLGGDRRNARAVQPACGRSPFRSREAKPEPPMMVCNNNGIVEHWEQCDDGHLNNDDMPNRCRTNCMPAHCGDGVTDQGEDCDQGAMNGMPGAYCNADCYMMKPHNVHMDMCAHWNYDNEGIWNTLGHGCENCAGERQSPIALPEACPKSTRPISLNHPSNVHYTETPVVLFNTGNQMLWPVMNGGTFSYHGNTYVLKHIEFHEPSEHYIGDKRFDFEVQLHHEAQNPGVHQNAVLAVLFEKSEQKNAFFEKFWNQLPVTDDCRCGNGIKEDVFVHADGRITKEECDNGAANSDTVADACRTDCTMPRCGDGVVDANEACDWGEGNSDTEPNACRSDCTVPSCGDGVVDAMFGEACDDGNCQSRDGCDAHCQPECGNGIIDGRNAEGVLEECDDGMRNSNTGANACRKDCTNARCGDGVKDTNEECDMGAMNSDEAANMCRSDCTLPTCGDGVVDAMEQCDPGAAGSTDACDANCMLRCGNGVLEAEFGEQCDHGPGNSNSVPNACRMDCTLARCGDLVRDSFEECDGPAPHCSPECKVVCGNGILECEGDIEEECDHGVLNSDTNPNACRTNCKLPSCGDGVTDMGASCFEECDNGALNSMLPNADCRPNCREPVCGDGVTDNLMGEQCDDGAEGSQRCSPGCVMLCGNGRVDPGEECDDGEKNGSDGCGCRATCTLSFCGDGIIDAGEECDDGANNKEGPNACRPGTCTLPRCGDGIVDHLYGERCDMGGENSETAVDGCSPRCTPNICRQSVNMDISVSPHDLLPTAPGVYCYDGSQNAPPCHENTQWFVFSSAQQIGECQLDYFKRILSNNARPAQCLNDRTVSWLEMNSVCGDGIVEGNEECDAGAHNSDTEANACRRNCKRAACGDGVQDAGEQCDGTPNCTAGCTLSCPAGSSCPNCNANANEATDSAASGTAINVNFSN